METTSSPAAVPPQLLLAIAIGTLTGAAFSQFAAEHRPPTTTSAARTCARLAVLSELTDEWLAAWRSWSKLNTPQRRAVASGQADG
ncbi:hypothetical protein KQH49_04790 [Mycetohabitans sp. B5]|uniref:hypothetical protein n=1 Tax=Mycetohabitans TaxID=2571159 RepID=UPI0018EC20F1|nr:hypothetical protein [Mycetohabitans sp. B5]